MKILAFLCLAVAALTMPGTTRAATAQPSPSVEALPGDSIYRLDLALVDQDGRGLALQDLRGGPVLISMFYSSCPYMCPLIIEAIKRNAHALDPAARARLRVVLVSFDSARDTPPVLKATAKERHIDLAHWTLARTDPAGVRRLAAVLDVQYRALADGGFNHSGALVLLDAQGRIVARTDKLGEVAPDFLAALQNATR
ncbi:MAG: SCO family protein [Proteobacteria bacterium]|uniref:SCO family protein n=1 Tax=Rudaea sp. TaxID=2136325 RepID=UPI0032203BF0|nr:SCO family protein [Pseudomonadota bacterium]